MRAARRNTLRHCLNGAFIAVSVALVTWFAVQWVTMLRVSAEWLGDIQVGIAEPSAPQRSDIVVLAITEDTLATMPFRAPVSRRFLSNLLDTLDAKNVRAVGLDVLFDQPTDPEEDDAFKARIRSYERPLVIAVGNAESNLTQRQLEFQSDFLSESVTGLANLVKHDGTVRYTSIYQPGADGEKMTFSAALASALGASLPESSQRIVFRDTKSAQPYFRVFPAERASVLPKAWLEDKIVLVGGILPHQDRHRTVLSVLGGEFSSTPGVLIHAHVLAQLLDGEGIPELPAPVQVALLMVLAGIAFLIINQNGPIAAKVLLAAIEFAVLWGGAFFVQRLGGPMLPLFSGTICIFTSLTVAWAYATREERAAKRFLRDAFTHYMSPNVIDDLIKYPEHLHLSGERREMSFVFADIEAFTSLSESMAPERLVGLLQEYQDGLVEIALKHGATIERFVGDATMIFFGAPVPQEDHAERAVRCAIDWDHYCQDFRMKMLGRDIRMGITRIGVHTGPAVVGNIGGHQRFAYTAHGDTVNIAARLETANKELGTRVCMSKTIADHCPDIRVRPVGTIMLKGKTEPLDVVTLSEDITDIAHHEYLRAFEALSAESLEGSRQIAALAKKYPDDGLLAFHRIRLMSGGSGVFVRLED